VISPARDAGHDPVDAAQERRGEGNGRMSTSMIATRGGRAAVAVLALALAGPAAGSAGNGVRLGGSEGRLHPFLEVEDRYDSNVYYTDQKQPVGDMVLHIRPGFDLAVPGDLAAAELGGSIDWAQYMGLDARETRSQLSKMYGQASLGLGLNRRGMLGLELDDEFRRAPGSTAFVLSNAVISNYNALRVRAPYRPGGGALVFTASGSWALETFESYFAEPICALCSGSVKALAYNEFRAGGDVKWRFLPRTAATFQGGWFSRVPNDSAVSSVSGLDGSAGFTGLVTPHVSSTLRAGYTSTLGVTAGNVSTWLATVEGEWMATDSASVKLGWTHGLGIDPGPVLFTAHRVYGAGRILLAGRYAARAEASFETRAYSPGSASASLVRIEPGLEAGITRWMSASLGYAFSRRTSSSFAVAGLPGFDFTKSETWLRLAVRY
jgi:hypothetical protein